MLPLSLRRASLTIVVALAGLALSLPALAQGGMAGHQHGHGGTMSQEDMKRWVVEFFSTHPVVGLSPTDVAVDTFIAAGTTFDTDGKSGTVVDTAFILTGQSILWRALNGIHTATNGTGGTDPNAGTLFDAPLNLSSPTFSHTFESAGTFRFFCRNHEAFNMRGVVVVTDPAAADTFLATQTQFDTDGNLLTQVDTAFIQVGDKILWHVEDFEFHTVTSGLDAVEPDAGSLFDVPLEPTNQNFVFQFNETGTFHFFCRPHEFDEMKGVVIVGTPVSVVPAPVGKRIGFVSEPRPNPTSGAIAFRVAMPVAGRASAEIFDVRGKLVAVPLDQVLDAGVFDAGWNGAARSGARAGPGVYHLRLSLPGYQATRRIVLAP